jgi:hypothetical protein
MALTKKQENILGVALIGAVLFIVISPLFIIKKA